MPRAQGGSNSLVTAPVGPRIHAVLVGRRAACCTAGHGPSPHRSNVHAARRHLASRRPCVRGKRGSHGERPCRHDRRRGSVVGPGARSPGRRAVRLRHPVRERRLQRRCARRRLWRVPRRSKPRLGTVDGTCADSIFERCARNADCERGTCVAPRLGALGDSCEERRCGDGLSCYQTSGGHSCQPPNILPKGARCDGDAIGTTDCGAGLECRQARCLTPCR